MPNLARGRRGTLDARGLSGQFEHMSARSPQTAARDLAAAGRRFYERGWVLGTSGNFSVVTRRKPLTLTITSSSVHKGRLRAVDFLQVDVTGRRLGRGTRNPSAETLLHTEIVRRTGAGAVLHTHSVWSTILSEAHAASSGLAIEGYEMLKGLEGVRSHEHRAWIPIVDNDQDMLRLSGEVGRVLDSNRGAHAFLIRRHGLYTWGATLAEAERHVEILEFLFETIGRSTVHHAKEQ
jgi:methylthioribulose-1-phosphate dehydratase